MSRSASLIPDIRVCAENGTSWACCEASSRPRMPYCLASTTIERPSGVSSASEDSCAASASACSDTPGAGTNATACRLPSVMVPVLSSSSVSTSPAASTARPDIASTLCCTSRSMPAMPIDEMSAPIVVGIRHTSSAISTGTGTDTPAYRARGRSVTTTSRNTRLSTASRMLSAISFGVFCRTAPSTSAIILSRKVLPGLDVTRTRIQSDSTRVPPVTAERSPPDSRITGADSPVIADSSTLATPSTISPSPGMISPAATRTTSPLRSSLAGTVSWTPSRMRSAIVSARVRRRLAACALPRPSAIASAKFANSTVNQSQKATWPVNSTLPVPPPSSSCTQITVVIRLPSSTMNITGLRTWIRGSSLRSESMTV